MCTYSMVVREWERTWPDRWPGYPIVPDGRPQPIGEPIVWPQPVSREDFEKMRREIEKLAELIRSAREYDKAVGDEDCRDVETEKEDLLRRLAELLEVELP